MQGVENFIEYCDEYLEEKWREINDIAENAPHDFLDDSYKKLKSHITDCLKSSTKSYHYVLPTQLLSKAVEHSLDCRSLQVSYGKPGAFDARSIAHKVIVPFDKRNYNVLGGSTEPYVNNPLRCSSVTRENKQRQKNKKDWGKLIEILDFVEQKDDVDFTEKIFKQVLLEIFRLLSEVRVLYPTPNRISLEKTIAVIRKFIDVSSGGERIEAVAAALFQEIAERFNLYDEVRREKVTTSDRSSGMAADIECYLGGEVVLLVEIKDRVLTLTQLESKLSAARARKIKEILFIAQKGIEEKKTTAIDDKIKSEFSSGQNIYITTLIEFASSILMLLGEKGRVNLLHRVGQELDRVNATIFHRKAWAKLLRES